LEFNEANEMGDFSPKRHEATYVST
jgi:hypothetical protein